jgi:hypothetical protein
MRSVLLLAAGLLTACASERHAAPRLTDDEFWRLSTALSEPGGSFHTDNFVSNELSIAFTLRQLQPAGGVYIGVGPEQNFSYIAALEPELAFIIDIRRANLALHLLYKALFQLSPDRAAFASRLFSRERPPGLTRDVAVDDLFAAYHAAQPSPELLEQTERDVTAALRQHGWPIDDDDTAEIRRALHAFLEQGPGIHYDRARPPSDQRPSYTSLMVAADHMGVRRSFLTNEDRFALVKDRHARNLIVPVVGDFGSGAVIARVADEIRRRGSSVTAFYASNVEVYLTNQQMIAFCGTLRALPWHADGVFIDSKGIEPAATKLAACPPDRRPFAGSTRQPVSK